MSSAAEHRLETDGALGALRRAVADAAKELARSFWPGADDAWLSAAELENYRLGTRHVALLIAAAAFGVSQACASWISWPTRTAWWVGMAVTTVALDIVSERLVWSKTPGPAEMRWWSLWQVFTVVTFFGVWCSMSVFLWSPTSTFNHMVIALLLACSLAASLPASAVRLANSLCAILVHAVFLIVPLALSPSSLDHTLAWLGAAFAGLMTIQASAFRSSIRRLLVLEHERGTLVDDLRSAKQESDRERARAAAAGRTKSQFLSNMNHELRTPMNAILGFSELIQQKACGAQVDKYAEYAEIIHESGRSLLCLIDEMLDLAKIEGGKLSLRESEFSLGELITDLCDQHETRAAEAGLSFVKKIAAGLPRVYADQRALSQVVANLASNALKFTPPGGCVTLFARLEDDGRIAFGVDDTGIGIAEEDQDHVFDRFGRGRHDVATADKGTGLGLAIVKGFVEAHDGTVVLESALGAGTRVTVYLPAERVRATRLRLTA